jgi:sugar-specific transcriptional regulator TrmB
LVIRELEGVESLSRERIVKTLEGFGISHDDIEVYMYLAKKGPKEENGLAKALQLTNQQLWKSIKNLKNKELVNSEPKQPTLYTALDFENALELLIRKKIEQAKNIENLKKKPAADVSSRNFYENRN